MSDPSPLHKDFNKHTTGTTVSKLSNLKNLTLKNVVDPIAKRTRSNKNIEFTELTFESKPRKPIMANTSDNSSYSETFNLNNTNNAVTGVTIKFDEAVKLIPKCSSAEDVYSFISACDLAIYSVDKKCVPILVKFIITRLGGKALDIIKFRAVEKWEDIKKHLRDAFQSEKSPAALQNELNAIQMNFDEDVLSYTARVETLHYKLLDIYTRECEPDELKGVIANTVRQTLDTYIKGLIKPIKNLVKARNPKTFEEAKEIAHNEEIDFRSEKDIRYHNYNSNNGFNGNGNKNRTHNNNGQNKNFNGNSRNNNSAKNNNYRNNNNGSTNARNNKVTSCYICQGNHYASQCRLNNNNTNGRNSNQNNRPPNQNNFSRSNSNARVISCDFCHKTGHSINECFKKRNLDANNGQRNSNVSGNDQVSNVTRGVRSINQISAENNDVVSQ